jgi:hypothetical protein
MISCEKDLRALVRKALPSVLWIEAGIGGSQGIPDCYLPREHGRGLWIELKHAEFISSKGIYRWKVRPDQKLVLEHLEKVGSYAIGIIGAGFGFFDLRVQDFLKGQMLPPLQEASEENVRAAVMERFQGFKQERLN